MSDLTPTWTPATGDIIAEVGGTIPTEDSALDRPMLYRVESVHPIVAAQPRWFTLRRLWVDQRPIRYDIIDDYGRRIGHRFIPTTEWNEIDPTDPDHPIQEYWDDSFCFDCNIIVGGHLIEPDDAIERPAWNTAFAHPTHSAWLCEDCHNFYTTDPLEA